MWGPVLGSDGTIFPCTVMGNLAWFDEMTPKTMIGSEPFENICRNLNKNMIDGGNNFSKICDKCTFYTYNFQKKGTLENTFFKRVVLS